ncbi:hypothetical protein [Prevotella aurantiaca]|uniref:hypothetical protein n=1 Tax=Prevotella aurantiaca TaxID=596085 RepID=UPI00046AE1F9|nr:hypothetical protein [Prevotella aurantiaca]
MMKKGDIFATLKAHFFAVTATQKEGFNTPFRTEKRPNGSSRKQVLLKERTIYKSDKCHE